jgi:hypothetical protein
LHITIRYLVRGQLEPTSVSLAPLDFFDPLGRGETWENDGIPRFNHACEYLPTSLDLAWTELESSTEAGVTSVREVVSPDRLVRHWHRVDPNGYEELCISSRLSAATTHISRLWRGTSEPWQLLFVSVITDLPDGSQSEALLYKGPSPDRGAV